MKQPTKSKSGAVPVFDYKKEFKHLFSPSAGNPEIVDVPPLKYIMADGQGYPGTSKEFAEKTQLLYSLAYTLKFMLKKDNESPFDFKVPPLSGLWYADDMAAFHDGGRKEEWKWTLMIMLPDRVTDEDVQRASAELKRKKNPPLLDMVNFKVYEEGRCAQIMHIGPYSEEAPTIQKLHTFFKEKGYDFNGHHHEIYLGDPRRSKPEQLKTIIRQPVKKV